MLKIMICKFSKVIYSKAQWMGAFLSGDFELRHAIPYLMTPFFTRSSADPAKWAVKAAGNWRGTMGRKG